MADWRTVDEWTDESEPYRLIERDGLLLLEAYDDGKWWRMITASGIHVLARRLASLLDERKERSAEAKVAPAERPEEGA